VTHLYVPAIGCYCCWHASRALIGLIDWWSRARTLSLSSDTSTPYVGYNRFIRYVRLMLRPRPSTSERRIKAFTRQISTQNTNSNNSRANDVRQTHSKLSLLRIRSQNKTRKWMSIQKATVDCLYITVSPPVDRPTLIWKCTGAYTTGVIWYKLYLISRCS